MLPEGYRLDEPAAAPGPPKLPKGYVMDHAAEQQASGPLPPPTYMGEQLGAVGRVAKNLFYEFPKYAIQSAVPRSPTEAGLVANPAALIAKHMGQDLWQGVTQAGQASQQAKQQGEGAAGQTLAALENYPVIGGMVRKAEEAGPGKIKLAPQTFGAVTEAALTFEGPQMLHGAANVLHNVIPSLPRSGAAIGLIRERIGTAPTGGTEGPGFAKANTEMNTLVSTGQPVPGPLKAFVEGVHQGAGKSIDVNAILDEAERNPEFDQKTLRKARADLATQEVMDKISPPKPDSGMVDPTTFKGLTTFRTIFNAWKYERSLPAASRNALGAAADAMAEEAQQIAAREGYGKEWTKYQAEYSRGKGAIRKAEKYGPAIGQGVGALAGAVAPELVRVPGAAHGYMPLAVAPGAYAGMRVGEKVGKLAEPVTKLIVNRRGTPNIRPLPPTPEAYTRTLLEAKEGKISPGEADRRIARMGGRVKVRPIPQPEEVGEP